MGDYDIQVRQPAPNDLIGSTVRIAALGTGFEATFGWQLRVEDRVIAEGFFDRGSTALMSTFIYEAPVDSDYRGPADFVLFGDTGADNPGAGANTIPVVVIPGVAGFVPHRVVAGETLTSIVASTSWGSEVTTVDNVVLASGLADPDRIEVGQLLRIPV